MRDEKRIGKIGKLLAAALVSLLFLCGCTKKEELVLVSGGAQEQPDAVSVQTAENESGGAVSDEEGAEEEPGMICVHVCGAVRRPGVYELPAGSRVYEAVREAGGFTEDAEESYVNQAQELPDGVKLRIPTEAEAAQAGTGAGDEESGWAKEQVSDGRVNINTASAEELCEIPGIGATRAAAILSYREAHGSFASPEDIMQVNGIKAGTYEKIKDSIRTE